MDCFRLRSSSYGGHVASLAMTWLESFPSRHFLRPRAEHVLARFLVERLLDELADRQPRLHLRPGAHVGVPALDVRVIVERKALRLVGHGPGEAGDVGDGVFSARDI